ncbi:LysR family transcriptional regulator [Mesorhizobium sp. M0488]|uniref:LysR family transcriptional regulator n=1 Tax=unclassified Mesorhizobium TaxID=325217 RepID=UPI003336D786
MEGTMGLTTGFGAGISRLSSDTIRVVRDVLKKKSLTQVALDLGISQPAVTFHIKKFEKLSNRRIIERVGNDMIVAADAASIVELFDEIIRLESELGSIAVHPDTRKTLGISSELFSTYTAHRLRALDLVKRFRVSVDSAAALSERYASAELSAVFRPLGQNESAPELTIELPMHWVGAGGNRTDGRAPPLPIILEPKSSGNLGATIRYLDEYVNDYQVVAEVTGESLKFLVEQGVGYAMLLDARFKSMGITRTVVPEALRKPFKTRFALFYNKRRISLREATNVFEGFAEFFLAA